MKNPLINWRTIIFLLILGGMPGCSQKTVEQQPPEVIDSAGSVTTIEEKQQDSIIDAHEYEAGIDALSIKDYNAAKDFFSRFAVKNPGLSGAYLNLAIIAYTQQAYDEAGRLIVRVLEINPRHPRAYHLRALLRQNNGEIRLAEKDYKKAIALNPHYTIAHYNLALLYDIFLQDLQPAIEHYSIYLELLSSEDKNTQDWINHLRNSLANG